MPDREDAELDAALEAREYREDEPGLSAAAENRHDRWVYGENR